MAGAEPWIGSYRPRVPSPSDADGSMPIDPASIDASSVRMSPNMFSVTMTSKSAGLRIRCIAQASTSMCDSARSGNSAFTTRSVTSRHSRDVSRTFALSTEVSFLRRPRVIPIRAAHRAQQDGVGGAAHLQRVGGQGAAGAVYGDAADQRLAQDELVAELRRHGLEDAGRLGDHLGSNSISRQNGDHCAHG